MRHIGDRHEQAEAARLLWVRFGEHRIVEIACVGAINGNQWHSA